MPRARPGWDGARLASPPFAGVCTVMPRTLCAGVRSSGGVRPCSCAPCLGACEGEGVGGEPPFWRARQRPSAALVLSLRSAHVPHSCAPAPRLTGEACAPHGLRRSFFIKHFSAARPLRCCSVPKGRAFLRTSASITCGHNWAHIYMAVRRKACTNRGGRAIGSHLWFLVETKRPRLRAAPRHLVRTRAVMRHICPHAHLASRA